VTGDAFSAAWRDARRGYSYKEHQGVGIYTLPAFDAFEGLRHGFSARMGGVSPGHLHSLNLSFTREEENRGNVMQNYRIFCQAAGIAEDSMVMDSFAHGTVVRRVDRADAGRGYSRAPLPACDALITDDAFITLVTGHADCMAIYFYDPVRRCIGLAHAGWRGALGRIGESVVRAMRESFGTQPEQLCAGIGPSICADCFEVGADLADAFEAAFPDTPCARRMADGKARVDLWMVALRQLMDAGLKAENLSLMGVCSFEDGRLYSHRRDHGLTGGMAAFLSLKQAAEQAP